MVQVTSNEVKQLKIIQAKNKLKAGGPQSRKMYCIVNDISYTGL